MNVAGVLPDRLLPVNHLAIKVPSPISYTGHVSMSIQRYVGRVAYVYGHSVVHQQTQLYITCRLVFYG